MAIHSLQMFFNHLYFLLDEMGKGVYLKINENKEIVYGLLAVAYGAIKWDSNRNPVSVTAAPEAKKDDKPVKIKKR